jgi:hypothetical protein
MMTLWRILVAGLVIGLVYSAVALYAVKIETRQLDRSLGRLESRGLAIQSEIDALDTEWSYLNSPDHLYYLIGLHSDVLQLIERVPDSFARLSELPPRGAGLDAQEAAQ